MTPPLRPSEAVIDLDAVATNTRILAALAAPATVSAVVKADGYGHGAVPVARAALGAGAAMLAVALVEEAAELRAAGIDAPILLLSQPPPGAESHAVALGLDVTVYHAGAVDRLADAASVAGRCRVHLKINTGMNRVGVSPEEALTLAKAIDAAPALDLAGTCTHFAVADEAQNPTTRAQADLFDAALAAFVDAGIDPGVRHAANSAAVIVDADRYRYDLVRPGIALYGIAPSAELRGAAPLVPVMELRSAVAHVSVLPAGAAISYGHRYRLERPSQVATVPLGYADGVRRNLSGGMDVLVSGRRMPIAGTITMDQFMVDAGDQQVSVGEEVVLIGSRGGRTISADDWADALDTIAYEVTCGVGARVPRRYHGEVPA